MTLCPSLRSPCCRLKSQRVGAVAATERDDRFDRCKGAIQFAHVLFPHSWADRTGGAQGAERALTGSLQYQGIDRFTHSAATRARMLVRSCDHRCVRDGRLSCAVGLASSMRPLHRDRNEGGTEIHASMKEPASSPPRANCRRCRIEFLSSRSAR